jgi:hypothetical protein
MDLYFLNFKHILIVLTSSDMRLNILQHFEDQDIETKVKFVDSYLEAAKLIQSNKSDPYNHVIVNLSFNNQKLTDFIEFIGPIAAENENYLIEFTSENELYPVELSQDG